LERFFGKGVHSIVLLEDWTCSVQIIPLEVGRPWRGCGSKGAGDGCLGGNSISNLKIEIRRYPLVAKATLPPTLF
jgi:hypothetical protein